MTFISKLSAYDENYVPRHSASIGSSLNVTVKGLTIEELKEKYQKRQPLEFSGEGGNFFARMGLLGKYLAKVPLMHVISNILSVQIKVNSFVNSQYCKNWSKIKKINIMKIRLCSYVIKLKYLAIGNLKS